MSQKTIVVGLSGGVDSSVAAYMCKQAGHSVVGLFMNNWEETDDSGVCTAVSDWEDAKAVADRIGIPCYSVNFSKQYYDRVFEYFLSESRAGRTPNPDVLCNREIKFGPFLDEAKKLGADLVATGHYAGVEYVGGAYRLAKSYDTNKDQTYFLNQLRQDQLMYAHFPLFGTDKGEVRGIADKLGLVTAKKKDSTGICFIGERNFRQFLLKYLPAKPGEIVDTQGVVLGEHIGLMYYTLGQRRGLDIGGRAGYDNARWFVVAKDMSSNRLVVSCGEGDELLSDSAECEQFNWIGFCPQKEFRAKAKFRYRQDEQDVTVYLQSGGTVKIVADIPQRALTPGQWAVLYDEKYCLGGGVIIDTSR